MDPSDGDNGVLRIPQSSIITGTSISDSLVSYAGHSLGELYPSTEMNSVYFTTLADWATTTMNQSESGSNSKERYCKLARSRELDPHYQMQFCIIPRATLFWEVGVLILSVEYRVFTAPTHRAERMAYKHIICNLPVCPYQQVICFHRTRHFHLLNNVF